MNTTFDVKFYVFLIFQAYICYRIQCIFDLVDREMRCNRINIGRFLIFSDIICVIINCICHGTKLAVKLVLIVVIVFWLLLCEYLNLGKWLQFSSYCALLPTYPLYIIRLIFDMRLCKLWLVSLTMVQLLCCSWDESFDIDMMFPSVMKFRSYFPGCACVLNLSRC